MRNQFALLVLLGTALESAEVIDRIAVIVNKRVIKSSDIAHDLRVTAFLNSEPLRQDAESRRKAAERLIDQSIIREQIDRGGYTKPSTTDADSLRNQILRDRFSGSAARMRQELNRYGLTEEELQGQLLWQLSVLRFIDQRFRQGVLVSDEEVRTHYERHLSKLQRQFPANHSYAALEDEIRRTLIAERINTNFEQWLADSRKTVGIEYREEALS